MNLVKRIDACITDMQAVCNNNGDDVVEEIAEHVADELAVCRDVAKELLAAVQYAVDCLSVYSGNNNPLCLENAAKRLNEAIAKAEGRD